jgi:drug/metabolite transporter (DMT)-like permease
MPRDTASPRRSAVYYYVAAATLLFSSMEVALKSIAGRFNALELNFLRFAIGGLFLLPLALRSLRSRGCRPRAGDLGFLALSGLACVVVSMTLYQLAIESCKASIVATLFSCNPAFVMILAAAFLGERIRPYSIASMLASLGGMACIMASSLAEAGASAAGGAGLVLTAASALAFAGYSVMGKARGGRLGALATTALSFILGSAELAILIAVGRVPTVARWLGAAGLGRFAGVPFFAGLDLAVLPAFAYVSLCVTGLGYAAYFMALEKGSAASASLVFYIKPALAPLLAFLILGEDISPGTMAGIGLIAVGSAVAVAGPRLRGGIGAP